MAQTERKQLVPLAFGFGLHRTKKNFLIIVFEPLLKDRHDIHSLTKNTLPQENGSTPEGQNQPRKNATKWAKNLRISCISIGKSAGLPA
jgi:hypothetical protein